MKIKPLSAVLDIILVPVAIAADVCGALGRVALGEDLKTHEPSETRRQIERVEEDLGL